MFAGIIGIGLIATCTQEAFMARKADAAKATVLFKGSRATEIVRFLKLDLSRSASLDFSPNVLRWDSDRAELTIDGTWDDQETAWPRDAGPRYSYFLSAPNRTALTDHSGWKTLADSLTAEPSAKVAVLGGHAQKQTRTFVAKLWPTRDQQSFRGTLWTGADGKVQMVLDVGPWISEGRQTPGTE